MLKRINVISFFILIVFEMTGQVDIELNVIPASDDAVGFTSSSIKLQFPIMLKKGVLIQGISFSDYNINYEDNQMLNTNELTNFKSIKYSIGFLKQLKNNWSFGMHISPTVSSNFESNLSVKDISLNGGIIFNKKINNSAWKIGLVMSSEYSLPIPIPLVNYSKRVNNRISYVLGFPFTKFEYAFNKRNKVNLFVKPNGFKANLSNSIQIENEEVSKAQYRSFVTGLNLTHQIDDYWKITIEGGHQLYSDYNLMNGNNKVYEFNTATNFYAGLKLKFNLIRKIKENEIN